MVDLRVGSDRVDPADRISAERACLDRPAAELGAVQAAAPLAELLAPYQGQWVAVAVYGGGGAVWGPVDHARARLARLAGASTEADALFAAAAHQARHAPLALARIRADQAST